MIARAKHGAGRIGRHREGRPGRVTEPKDAPTGPVSASSTPLHGTVARRRRAAEAPQDLAVYACQCGLAFEAQVSTSVDCPRCGGTQAW